MLLLVGLYCLSGLADPLRPVLLARWDKVDSAYPRIFASLEQMFSGTSQPTDLHFVPGSAEHLIVLQKQGSAILLTVGKETKRELWKVSVNTDSEMGLLGVAFHPQFPKNRLLCELQSQRTEFKDPNFGNPLANERLQI